MLRVAQMSMRRAGPEETRTPSMDSNWIVSVTTWPARPDATTVPTVPPARSAVMTMPSAEVGLLTPPVPPVPPVPSVPPVPPVPVEPPTPAAETVTGAPRQPPGQRAAIEIDRKHTAVAPREQQRRLSPTLRVGKNRFSAPTGIETGTVPVLS